MGRIADHRDVPVLLRIGAGLDDDLVVAGILLGELAHRAVVDRHELDVAGAREVHHRRGRRGGAEREHLHVAVLHHRDRVGVGRLEVDLAERLVVHAVELQHRLGQQLAGVALRLRDDRLALHVGERLHLRVLQRHHLEVLRIEVRDLADLRRLLRVRRTALDAVDRRGGVREADLRLAFVDAAHVGDARTGRLLDLQARNGGFPHVLERAPQRDPRAALRTGHERDLLRQRGNGECGCGGGRETGERTLHESSLGVGIPLPAVRRRPPLSCAGFCRPDPFRSSKRRSGLPHGTRRDRS